MKKADRNVIFKDTIESVDTTLDKLAEFRRNNMDGLVFYMDSVEQIYDALIKSIDSLKFVAEDDTEYAIITELFEKVKDSLTLLTIKRDLNTFNK